MTQIPYAITSVRRAAAIAAVLLLAATPLAGGATKVGTPGPDTLRAGSGGDLLWGGGGEDTLIGGRGDDRLYGVRAHNRISGGAGDDYIEGGAGNDTISTGPGRNTVFSTSGQDVITTGDGNNYVDVGGGTDTATLGDGDNILVTASGGGRFRLGNGDNTVFYGSGIAYITAGSGANTFYLAGTAAVRELNCGGNPASVVYVDARVVQRSARALDSLRRKAKGCSRIETFDGEAQTAAQTVGRWETASLTGGPGRDKLLGGHAGGTIDGGEGDNELWADQFEETGLPRSRGYTTTITAGDGNNRIFGGRGTNVITVGNGTNLVRAGAWNNEIRVGSGDNLVRLQGAGTNVVTIVGRGSARGTYVESLATNARRRPAIRCEQGARATIVYGRVKPTTTCAGKAVSVYSKAGQRLQIEHTPGVPAADPVLEGQPQPGDGGIGVPRPNGGA